MPQTAPTSAAPDPLIDEVRQYRADLDRKFGDDWNAFGAFIRQSAANIRKEFDLKAAEVAGRDPSERTTP